MSSMGRTLAINNRDDIEVFFKLRIVFVIISKLPSEYGVDANRLSLVYQPFKMGRYGRRVALGIDRSSCHFQS
ncbi:MAG: hypothetical protein EAZ91_02715 [Cytophagales bacterium]|nr:MAG: hypothetical protein EAZ91_02715 [Cytophagales bacterium]